MNLESPAFDAICAADHPSPSNGGPCATCAFRPGTEANATEHTVALAKMCVEGLERFDCHEYNRMCRGWLAAVNLRAQDDVKSPEAREYIEAHRAMAGMLANAIGLAKEAEDLAGRIAKEQHAREWTR